MPSCSTHIDHSLRLATLVLRRVVSKDGAQCEQVACIGLIVFCRFSVAFSVLAVRVFHLIVVHLTHYIAILESRTWSVTIEYDAQ